VFVQVQYAYSEHAFPANESMSGASRHDRASAELYEVLRDRALCAFAAEAWGPAHALLRECTERCPADEEVRLLWDVLKARKHRSLPGRQAA